MKILFVLPAIGKKPGEKYIKTWRLMEPLTISTLKALTPPKVETFFLDDRIEAIDYQLDCEGVFISVEMYTARRAWQIAKVFRSRGIPVIAGGYHPTLNPEEAMQHVDAVLQGNAETVWETMLEDLQRGKLKSLYFGEAGFRTGLIPDRTIFKGKKYSPLALIETGRGCVFNCDFCTITAAYAQRYHRRPIADVIEDIRSSGKKFVFFVDDNIVSDPHYAIELFKALVPLKIRWSAQGSLTMARNDELLHWMKKSGCIVILIGYESMNPKTLQRMNKSWAYQQDERDQLTQKIHRHGIGIYATFVFGYDDETAEDYERALSFARKHAFFFVAFNHLLPFPGTALHERFLREKRLTHPQWWLQAGYRYGDIPYRTKGVMEGKITEACADLRHRFFSLGSILKRFLITFPRHRSLIASVLFLTQNLNLRREVDEKLQLPIGEGLDVDEKR